MSEYSNVFDRTAIFLRDKKDNGDKVFKRIPWDLIAFDGGSSGPFISPAPVGQEYTDTGTSTTYSQVDDLMGETTEQLIDEIQDVMYFESEETFYSKFENVVGYYKSDPSLEFGYPCV